MLSNRGKALFKEVSDLDNWLLSGFVILNVGDKLEQLSLKYTVKLFPMVGFEISR